MLRLVVAVVAAVLFGFAGFAATNAAAAGSSLGYVAIWFCLAMAALSIALALPGDTRRRHE